MGTSLPPAISNYLSRGAGRWLARAKGDVNRERIGHRAPPCAKYGKDVSAFLEGEDPAELGGVGDVGVEDDLLGAVEAEIGRLPDTVLDPDLAPFPQECPDRARAKLQSQEVLPVGDLCLMAQVEADGAG